MGEVVRLPRQPSPAPLPPASTAPGRGDGDDRGWSVDDWGRDDLLARASATALRLGWSVTLGGAERLPADGAAMLVTNSRRFTLAPWMVALLASTTTRPVRFVGRPDAAPFGAVARRLGGLLDRRDEVAGALAGGQLVVIGAAGTLDPRAVGAIDPVLVGAAVRAGVPVFPVATSLTALSRTARIEIGAAVKPPANRRGPFREAELAERLRQRIGELLDSSGLPRTGTPLDWIPLNLSVIPGGR